MTELCNDAFDVAPYLKCTTVKSQQELLVMKTALQVDFHKGVFY